MRMHSGKLLILSLLFLVASPWCLYHSFRHDDNLYEASYSPDGALVAVGSDNGKHRIYSSPSNQVVYTYPANQKAYSVKYSPNQQYLAFGLENDSIIILNSTYGFVKELPTSFDRI